MHPSTNLQALRKSFKAIKLTQKYMNKYLLKYCSQKRSQGGGGYSPPLAQRKRGKNALSAHLPGLFAAIGVSNDL